METGDAVDAARVGAYKLGDKTVLKGGYGLYYDTLNAADYTANVLGYSSTTTNTNSTDFGQTFTLGNPYAGVLGIADPFPVRADGTRFDEPVGVVARPRHGRRLGASRPRTRPRARPPAAVAARRPAGARPSNLSVEMAYDGSYSDRIDVSIRQDYLPEQYWIPAA